MCGIAGIIDFSAKSLQEKKNKQQAASKIFLTHLKNRGPDGAEFFLNNSAEALLCHTRLAITDLSVAGKQPMQSQNKRFTIVLNGEIYNTNVIKKKYLCEFNLKSSTDTEIVLEAFAKAGQQIFLELEGIFAFGIWDQLEKKLWLCKDHLGIKPLYFHYDSENKKIIFASIVKPIAKILNAQKNIDCWNNFQAFGCLIGKETTFLNIENFTAGHFATFDENSGLRFHSNYSIKNLIQDAKKPLDSKENFIDIFSTILKSQIPAKIPCGVFLSAGLDSNFIASQLYKIGIKFYTFSIGFEVKNKIIKNEAPFAKKLASIWGSVHHEWIVSQKEFKELWEEFLSTMDQPSTDGFNTFLAAKLAKNFCKVVFSGLGADELLLGYWHFNHISRWLWLNKHLPNLTKNIYSITNKLHWLPKFNSFLFRNKVSFFRDLSTKNSLKNLYLFFRNIQEKAGELNVDKEINIIFDSCDLNNWQKIILAELYFYNQFKLLRDADQFAMHSGVEIRVPFLDKRLIISTLQLMKNQNISSWINKESLKNYFKNHHPQIQFPQKQGFELPIANWLERSNIFHPSQLTNLLIKKNY